MTDTPAAETAAEDTTATEAPAAAPAAQEDVDWKTKAREWEKRAKANADAAKRLQQIEDANKTEAQRAADELARLRADADDARSQLLRHEVAADLGVPPKLVRFLTGTAREDVEASARDLLEAIRSEPAAAPPARPTESVRRVTNGGPPATQDAEQWFRSLAGR